MQDNKLTLITGGSHSDDRGTICFVNDFDMSAVKRFYRIKNHDTELVRGWRAHKIEQRWFHVSSGGFEVKLIAIDNWENPSAHLKQEVFFLKATDNAVLHIPAGYASSIRAVEENSELIVFADYPIEHAKNDDYLFPLHHFN